MAVDGATRCRGERGMEGRMFPIFAFNTDLCKVPSSWLISRSAVIVKFLFSVHPFQRFCAVLPGFVRSHKEVPGTL